MSEHGSITGLQKFFLENKEIHISGFIDDETADYVHECMLHLQANGSPDIRVMIRSHGGQTEAGLHIYDDLRHYAGETKGIIRGFAHSTAAIILQGCAKRLAYRHSTFLIHDTILAIKVPPEYLTAKNVAGLKRDMLVTADQVEKLFAHHSNLSITKIRALMKLDKQLSAAEALKFGFIDKLC